MAGSLPSLGSKLDGARAKARRANEHIRGLKQSLKRFGQRNTYASRTEVYSHGTPEPAIYRRIRPVSSGGLILPSELQLVARTIRLRILISEKPGFRPPVLRWGVMVGEIAHNLTSALDNLIFELGEANPNAPQPGDPGYHWHDTRRGYPLRDDASHWLSDVGRYLFFVDPALHAVFKQAQPFDAWKNMGKDPKLHPAWIIRQLWNGDKHRTVNLLTTVASHRFTNVRIPDRFPDFENLPTQEIESFSGRPIIGETEMAIIRVYLPEEISVPTQFNVNVHPHLTLRILFGQGPAGVGEDVIAVLEAARDYTVDMLNKFA